jgi:large subunit ribosomal protein L25
VEEIEIRVTARKERGSRVARRLRHEGKVPGTLYGKGVAPTPIVMSAVELERALSRGGRMLSVNLDGNQLKAIIREVQHSPLTDRILHVDFHRVILTEKVTVPVRIEMLGQPKCQPEEGVLELHMSEVTVECLPTNLPDKLVIDMRNMAPGDVLRIRDIALPSGVTALEDPEEPVISIVRPAEEVEVKPPEEGAEPEVIGKVKEEAEEETEEKQKEKPEKTK